MRSTKVNRNVGAAVLFLIFGLLFFVLIVRFLTIQITGEVDGKVMAAKAAHKYLRTDVLDAHRGTIYDNNGEVIAEDADSFSLVAILDPKMTTDADNPRHVTDPRKTAEVLSKYIDMSEDEIYDRLTLKGRFQVEFGTAGRDISVSEKKKIEAEKLPGITFKRDSKRFYPNGVFASHLIGYAQTEEGKDGKSKTVGKMGLEKSFNSVLSGKDGSIQYESDLWGYLLPNKNEMVKKPQNGSDIYLTLDKKIQTFLEDSMNEVEEKYKPKRMLAIVADPKTGKILAMGQRPTFHPSTREGIGENWHNENVEAQYEPGSTMKVFTLSAAIEKGVFHPNEKYQSGTYKVGQVPIRDHNGGVGWGKIPFLEGVQRSSNVAFVKLLEKMGDDTFRDYLDRFGFGKPTGINLPHEASGNILFHYPIEKATTAFGQGTTVTPLQLIQGMTAIANNGTMMKPYVVDKVVNPNNGEEKITQPEVAGHPIKPDTAKEVRDVLGTVITAEHGTGKGYALDGYSVAGKTGTAQIPDPNGPGYLTGWDNYIFSFIGMAPKDDPKLIMYVAVQQPQLDDETYEGGSVPVSMIFNPVMKSSLQYMNIKPEKNIDAKMAKVPDLVGGSVANLPTSLKENGIDVVEIGSGARVTDQLPKAGQTLLAGEKLVLKTDGEIHLPNMTGWSKRDVLKISQLADLKLNMVGNGYAANQNLKPNSPVSAGDQLVVNFMTPQEKMAKDKAEKDKKDNKEDKTPQD
ncbi:penicillin-binding protein [Falsibacillus pallidus]|uniref:serine-type D-Ala-D-Ala carboxypeptidase n=1 Tax=Falsibacillus pallidus TaxID=493781 RepID=A0A370GV32_9BACI|nr:penicillin-binding transpeptidase domain-containing protein [Falsibacillus pallidus]RDI47555.1 penicillin-binding protein 2B [Falsibacillus pallidus]